MPDPFEILISLGAGFARGGVQRKRENELLQLEQKKAEQQRISRDIDDVTRALLSLAPMVDFETLQQALVSVPGQVRQGRQAAPFGVLEQKPPPGPQEPTAMDLLKEEELRAKIGLTKARTESARALATQRKRNTAKQAKAEAAFQSLDQMVGKLEKGETVTAKQFNSQAKIVKEDLMDQIKTLDDDLERVEFNFEITPEEKKAQIAEIDRQKQDLRKRVGEITKLQKSFQRGKKRDVSGELRNRLQGIRPTAGGGASTPDVSQMSTDELLQMLLSK